VFHRHCELCHETTPFVKAGLLPAISESPLELGAPIAKAVLVPARALNGCRGRFELTTLGSCDLTQGRLDPGRDSVGL
jgi:hypothetical protein